MANFISKMFHISSSEEVLLPGTEDSTLEMGLYTQHLHTSLLPFPFLLCPFFFFFFFPTTPKLLPLVG